LRGGSEHAYAVTSSAPRSRETAYWDQHRSVGTGIPERLEALTISARRCRYAADVADSLVAHGPAPRPDGQIRSPHRAIPDSTGIEERFVDDIRAALSG
jgi:hypothetical protein